MTYGIKVAFERVMAGELIGLGMHRGEPLDTSSCLLGLGSRHQMLGQGCSCVTVCVCIMSRHCLCVCALCLACITANAHYDV